jgi:hypothetical protein
VKKTQRKNKLSRERIKICCAKHTHTHKYLWQAAVGGELSRH